MPGTSRRGGSRPEAKEAVIYLSGLKLGLLGEKSKRGVVTRLARSLGLHAMDPATTYLVAWNSGAIADGPGNEDVATILRSRNGEEQPVLDFYALDWAGELNKRWRAQSKLTRAMRLIFSLLSACAFVRFFRTSGKKNPTGRMQLGLAVAAVIVVAAYLVLLVIAVAQTAWQAKERYLDAPAKPPAASSTKEPGSEPPTRRARSNRTASETGDDGATMPQSLALLGTGVAAVWPKARRKIAQVGTALGAAASYVRVGLHANSSVGAVDGLVKTVASKGYDRITFIAYSFGSVLALDALYPTTHPPEAAYRKVDTLVTIGCPFDYVRALRPSWHTGRNHLEGVPDSWLNVYSKIDLLGSNFRSDKAEDDALLGLTTDDGAAPLKPTRNLAWDVGIEPKMSNLIEFHGFASHGLYWGADEEVESNVFDLVVGKAFDRRSILGAPVGE